MSTPQLAELGKLKLSEPSITERLYHTHPCLVQPGTSTLVDIHRLDSLARIPPVEGPFSRTIFVGSMRLPDEDNASKLTPVMQIVSGRSPSPAGEAQITEVRYNPLINPFTKEDLSFHPGVKGVQWAVYQHANLTDLVIDYTDGRSLGFSFDLKGTVRGAMDDQARVDLGDPRLIGVEVPMGNSVSTLVLPRIVTPTSSHIMLQ